MGQVKEPTASTIFQYYDIVELMKKPKKRQRADTREDMIVTTCAFDRGQHARLKIAAVELSTVLTAIVRQAVEEWLDRYEKRGRSR
jgi:hypothetical protein